MTTSARPVRPLLEEGFQEVLSRHRTGAGGWETCRALTEVMDRCIRAAYEQGVPAPLQPHCAILATGGYGRGELCPRSDVDVMVLIALDGERRDLEDAARSFLHILWDAGLDVGHSVRTVDEAMSLHGLSLDAWTSMLEGRFVCGDDRVFKQLTAGFRERIAAGPDPWFLRGVFSDMRTRHERFGTSVKLLEPNIKKSAGGLRDMHMPFWLHRASDGAFFVSLSETQPAALQFLDILVGRGELTGEEAAALSEAVGFLLRVRHEMHYRRTAADDTLEYTLQHDVAEGLGFGGGSELRSVEVFMAAYYRHARTVHRHHRRLSQRFRDILEPSRAAQHGRGRWLGNLHIDEGVLSLRPGGTHLGSAREVFEAFVLAADERLELDFRLSGAIERSLDVFTGIELESAELSGLFRRVLHSGRVGSTLYTMNELGVLGRYLPEFGALIAFFQHNVYHYYTADEHTLIAVVNAERLQDKAGPLGTVFRSLPDVEVLYWAVLLHDIAKPLGVADHEITGVDMARTLLTRLGAGSLFPAVGFLVRNHLVMEQTAFRRNVHDPATIGDFAARCGTPELLDYLYLLTYADLSALNTNVWTDWKAAMLHDLYQRTREVLRKNLRGAAVDRFHEAQYAEAVARVMETLRDDGNGGDVGRHLRGMNSDAYLSVFGPDEIAAHVRESARLSTVATEFRHHGAHTDVTVIARDAPFLLSRFCAVLSANDANIFDANVFTRDDGIIIDRFRVSSAFNRRQLDPAACTKIEAEMRKIVDGQLDIEQLFREHHRKWKRRTRTPANPNIRTDVEFEDTPRYTIIDVYAPDSVGFLYRVTESISRLGLHIYFAKIATRVDGIVDAFYVLDQSGQPVHDPVRRAAIRDRILGTITSTTELAPA